MSALGKQWRKTRVSRRIEGCGRLEGWILWGTGTIERNGCAEVRGARLVSRWVREAKSWGCQNKAGVRLFVESFRAVVMAGTGGWWGGGAEKIGGRSVREY